MDYQAILDKAHAAARAAVAGGKDDGACGFAWVVSKDLKLNRWCKKQLTPVGVGQSQAYGNPHHRGGWCFWKPGNFRGQALHVHEAGAEAFCQVLKQELGSDNFYVGSRLD